MNETLHGKKILVTRQRRQINEMSSLIREKDGIPFEVPLLKIMCHQHIEVDAFSSYSWLIFTSANGVRCFFQHVKEPLNRDINIAAVGKKTAQIIKSYGYEVDFIPSTYNADVMMDEFFELYPSANNFLVIRGNISRSVIPEQLAKRKRSYMLLEVYETIPFIENKQLLIEVLTTNKVDFLSFTSPSAVRAFVELTKEHAQFKQFLTIPAVCIGTTTEKEAKRQAFQTTIVPDTFTVEHMVEEMTRYNQMEGSF